MNSVKNTIGANGTIQRSSISGPVVVVVLLKGKNITGLVNGVFPVITTPATALFANMENDT